MYVLIFDVESKKSQIALLLHRFSIRKSTSRVMCFGLKKAAFAATD